LAAAAAAWRQRSRGGSSAAAAQPRRWLWQRGGSGGSLVAAWRQGQQQAAWQQRGGGVSSSLAGADWRRWQHCCSRRCSIYWVSKIAICCAIAHYFRNMAMPFFYVKLTNSLFYSYLFYRQQSSALVDKRCVFLVNTCLF
jgi:hypothetical protein